MKPARKPARSSKPPALVAIPGNHDIPLFNLAARMFAPYAGFERAYGANGVGPAFEYSGDSFIPIDTGMPAPIERPWKRTSTVSMSIGSSPPCSSHPSYEIWPQLRPASAGSASSPSRSPARGRGTDAPGRWPARNAGATISFNGGLVLSTGANQAFTATGGGTVNVTGASSVATTTGTAVRITGTTIGGAGVKFDTISSNGGAGSITAAVIK